MRVIIRAVLAIGILFLIANYLADDNPIALAETKDVLLSQEPIQQFLNSKAIQDIQNFELDDVMPSDLF
ncbi:MULTISPECIES: hypothetical protein [unclassified Staphylococcus]|uniref:hypothetical protein n=1 Tax=unclassified Staphylococcus TaxID=91994 RepID=UPI0021D17CAE|nr:MULTISPECIES: hypothetical protein [unclassified Staphylococcus]UXR69438.1 hypothetical protein MUA26_10010 [Staphylococcus sp. IVB6246]UXR71493.1 hypothetical protein MUA88_10030 [Staphylococcus sp. IVB6240]UXR73771.1 hypothetical protein MUA48_10530 [Staphylococcus sp. IVB6238]UXR76090.1 hypothetical protein MUA74_10630 [Staphylococcus sp. IVB6233]UXR80288.1 hypothetical protein MUA65_10235 [Staphylococcus sp. IVB6218]